MNWTIRQTGETAWELVNAAGEVVATHSTYALALDDLSLRLNAALAADDGEDESGTEPGLLPEPWVSRMAYSRDTGDGRNFAECDWSWRDPARGFVPLMLQTATDFGHFGAQLAGYIESIVAGASDLAAEGRGRFYDSEIGRQFRDMLLSGPPMGVSVDPGAVVVEEECVEVGEDGWCQQWQWNFAAYEIIGLTGTPFPGFAEADITLGSETAAVEEQPADEEEDESEEEAPPAEEAAAHSCSCGGALSREALDRPLPLDALIARRPRTAAAVALLAPSRAWFERIDGLLAPLRTGEVGGSIRVIDDVRVYGYVCDWTTCHVGYLPNECWNPPQSQCNYAHARTGYVVCDDGTEIATSPLTIGTGHADLMMSGRGAMEHYERTGTAVADIVIGDDAYGPWFAGALRPGVTPEQVRTLRASAPSGDWRPIGTRLEMVAVLGVNHPGLPRRRARVASGRVMAMVASGAIPRPHDGLDPDIAYLLGRARAEQSARLQASARRAARRRLAGLAR